MTPRLPSTNLHSRKRRRRSPRRPQRKEKLKRQRHQPRMARSTLLRSRKRRRRRHPRPKSMNLTLSLPTLVHSRKKQMIRRLRRQPWMMQETWTRELEYGNMIPPPRSVTTYFSTVFSSFSTQETRISCLAEARVTRSLLHSASVKETRRLSSPTLLKFARG